MQFSIISLKVRIYLTERISHFICRVFLHQILKFFSRHVGILPELVIRLGYNILAPAGLSGSKVFLVYSLNRTVRCFLDNKALLFKLVHISHGKLLPVYFLILFLLLFLLLFNLLLKFFKSFIGTLSFFRPFEELLTFPSIFFCFFLPFLIFESVLALPFLCLCFAFLFSLFFTLLLGFFFLTLLFGLTRLRESGKFRNNAILVFLFLYIIFYFFNLFGFFGLISFSVGILVVLQHFDYDFQSVEVTCVLCPLLLYGFIKSG